MKGGDKNFIFPKPTPATASGSVGYPGGVHAALCGVQAARAERERACAGVRAESDDGV